MIALKELWNLKRSGDMSEDVNNVDFISDADSASIRSDNTRSDSTTVIDAIDDANIAKVNNNVASDTRDSNSTSSSTDVATTTCSSPSTSSSSIENPCRICLDEVAPDDRFRPCNCRFAYVHRQCLRDWIAHGVNGAHQRCDVCTLMFDVNRVDAQCAVCRRPARHLRQRRGCFDLLYQCISSVGQCCLIWSCLCNASRTAFIVNPVCRCENIVLHQQCLSDAYDCGVYCCPYCQATYDPAVVSLDRCRSRWHSAAKPIFLLLTVLAALMLFVFLIGGNMWLSLLASATFTANVGVFNNGTMTNMVNIDSTLALGLASMNNATLDVAAGSINSSKVVYKTDHYWREFAVQTHDRGSIFLFPGAGHDTFVIDLVFGMVACVTFLLGGAFGTMMYCKRRDERRRRDPFRRAQNGMRLAYVTLGSVLILLVHLLGNMHYTFYWMLGVIPLQNWFWVFDLRSFLAGCFVVFQVVSIGLFVAFVIVLLPAECLDWRARRRQRRVQQQILRDIEQQNLAIQMAQVPDERQQPPPPVIIAQRN